MRYAAKIEQDTVTQVIVGDAAWAASRLGGVWLPSEVNVGVGWLVVDGVITPPPAPEVGETDLLDFEGS